MLKMGLTNNVSATTAATKMVHTSDPLYATGTAKKIEIKEMTIAGVNAA
jgi:hypothetical protein